jgi:hypothetical protein
MSGLVTGSDVWSELELTAAQFLSGDKIALSVKRTFHSPATSVQNVCVNHRGPDVLVT